jgi:hypothetical protein
LQTSSGAQSGSTAIGGGQGTASVSSTIGGSRSTSGGGAGGSGGNGAGGSAYSGVTVNVGDPSGSGTGATDPNASRSANAQSVPSASTSSQDIHERVTTVGNPGSSSYGVSFSQYNCASTAGAGVGFMGGAFQFGVGKESDPCNARANAAALFSIAQTLATTNPSLSAQLFRAAILLVGNSTGATKDALATAGVSDFATSATTTPTPAIVPPVPPAAPAMQPDEGKATPVPEPKVAAQPLAPSAPVPVTVSPDQNPALQPSSEKPPATHPQQTADPATAATDPATPPVPEQTLESVKRDMYIDKPSAVATTH